ncbi:MAG: S24/S26 family peptidase [Acidimicrobiales bacterium]
MIISPSLLSAVQELGWWTLRRRDRFRVSGNSMEPTLLDGDFVLVDAAAVCEIGDLVVAEHPDEDTIVVVKRLADRSSDSRVILSSDNPAGSDSRTWGPVPDTAIRGRVQLVLGRPLASMELSRDETQGRAPNDGVTRWLRR